MQDTIQKALQLRKDNKHEQALALLAESLKTHPDDPIVNYHTACTCDFLGKESEAAPYYEKAIANGLAGEDRQGAMLGLGSTYRCLGEYEKSLKIFDQAMSEFPEDRSFNVFRALTLYNLGRAEEAVSALLVQLLDTTKDETILPFERALRFYSDKLNETWK